jgi:N-acetyl-gamma-glutamyl-phosphate reductase
MMEKRFKVGIIGGAGYTGGEALRILIYHPFVELSYVHSRSNSGKFVHQVHSDLLGDTDIKFSANYDLDVDAVFLCLGHGESKKFLEEAGTIPGNVKIIDLSQDFRLAPGSGFGERKFVYGLPELNKEAIRKTNSIANPGCFATCIQLGLLPLAKAGIIKSDIHIQATTGSTGAGQSLSATSHFSWRHSNLSAYKVFNHQHLNEIKQSVNQLNEFSKQMHFVPLRGAFARGILANLYTETDKSAEELLDIFRSFYSDAPFVTVTQGEVHLKQVVNTNKCIISVEKHGDQVFVTSIIDNLLKGASGQAVQNMNLMLGLEETAGLKLKPVGY